MSRFPKGFDHFFEPEPVVSQSSVLPMVQRRRFFGWLGLTILCLNPDFAVFFYCGAELRAATLVSRFLTSTYRIIRPRPKTGPTSRFAMHFDASLRTQLQNPG